MVGISSTIGLSFFAFSTHAKKSFHPPLINFAVLTAEMNFVFGFNTFSANIRARTLLPLVDGCGQDNFRRCKLKKKKKTPEEDDSVILPWHI